MFRLWVSDNKTRLKKHECEDPPGKDEALQALSPERRGPWSVGVQGQNPGWTLPVPACGQ